MTDTELQQDTFLFDDYFSDPDDPGVEVVIHAKGKDIPFHIRRVLTLGEKQAASDAAVKIDFDVKGNPKLRSVNQGMYTEAIVLAGLKAWPYEYAPGKPVPINAKTVHAHDGGINEQLAALILGIAEVQQQALTPFEMKSDEA
jgi:hypothetical protein